MSATHVTVVGNVVDEPRSRDVETRSGGTALKVSFRIASTERRLDRATGEWSDGQSLFLNVTCWRQLAENIGGSLRKGDPVIVRGKLYTRTYEHEGQMRSSFELDASVVGHDLSRGRAAFTRTARQVVPDTYETVEVDPVTGEISRADAPEDDPATVAVA